MEEYISPDIVSICFEPSEFINESFTESPGEWGNAYNFDE